MDSRNYLNKDTEWLKGLHNHLLKAEIEWVACNGGGTVSRLKEYEDVEGMKNILRELGFRIKDVIEPIDETDKYSILTSSNIYVFLNGYVIKIKK